jgi:hypothetical protein
VPAQELIRFADVLPHALAESRITSGG